MSKHQMNRSLCSSKIYYFSFAWKIKLKYTSIFEAVKSRFKQTISRYAFFKSQFRHKMKQFLCIFEKYFRKEKLKDYNFIALISHQNESIFMHFRRISAKLHESWWRHGWMLYRYMALQNIWLPPVEPIIQQMNR